MYIEATAEWEARFKAGQTGKGDMAADGIAAKYAARVPEGFRLTGRMLKNALLQGRSGIAPQKPGPKPAVPDQFVAAVG